MTYSFLIDSYSMDNTLDHQPEQDTTSKPKQKNGRKRRSNKQKAEAQFDFNAAPVTLQHYFLDAMEISVDEPDLTVPLTGTEEIAPMKVETKVYPSNHDELAPQILDIADDFLEFAEKIENDVPTDPPRNQTKIITQQIAQIQVAKMMKDLNPDDRNMRITTKRLTAKRLAFGSLQMFSFNDNYDKHFTMDKLKLRSINTDMLIDVSNESVKWLNNLGLRYQSMYLQHLGISIHNDEQIIRSLDPTHSHFRALGFSTLLKHIDYNILDHNDKRLEEFFEFLKDRGYHNVTLRHILRYFGIKILGIDNELDYQLNYLHLIPYYLQSTKKKKIFGLFADLDKTSLFNNK